uniref:Uncharacterized protein n=1 Tax=Lygus hesperus TaxID=30085 RepID=A0A146M656_LYGHE
MCIIVAMACAVVALMCSVLQVCPPFLPTTHVKLQKISRTPLTFCLIIATATQVVALGVLQAMYLYNWCVNDPPPPIPPPPPPHHGHNTKHYFNFIMKSYSNSDCNPLNGCVYSFK